MTTLALNEAFARCAFVRYAIFIEQRTYGDVHLLVTSVTRKDCPVTAKRI